MNVFWFQENNLCAKEPLLVCVAISVYIYFALYLQSVRYHRPIVSLLRPKPAAGCPKT